MNICFDISKVTAVAFTFTQSAADWDYPRLADRFVHSASALTDGGFLGLQIAGSSNGVLSGFLFSDRSTAPEDFAWILQPAATAASVPPDRINSFFAPRRKTVALVQKRNSYNNNEMSWKEKQHLGRDLLRLMQGIDAMLQIILEPNRRDDARGVVQLSLPEEMPLRMRTMLCYVFPDTAIGRPGNRTADQHNLREIPVAQLNTGILTLIRALAAAQRKHTDETMEKPERNHTGKTAYTEEAGASPIEDLDLSVRTYNCLKRVGIDSVEQLLSMGDDEIRHIRNMGERSYQEVKEKLSAISRQPAPVMPADTDYFAALNALIGLDTIKEQVRKIAALARMQNDRKSRGLDTAAITLNMAFTGSPGTAKTTVARILAGLFHQVGLLPENELVEVGRSALIARYEGQTADRVRRVFERARGKLLFIDEAYALVDNREGAYGDEAINTIVQEMENRREDTVVIFAGYPKEMEAFFARNPGLRSRVPFHLSFPDYSADEMTQIVKLEAEKRGFSVQPQAREKVLAICEAAEKTHDAGNGRFSRNLAECAILSYAFRVYGDGNSNAADQDLILVGEDFSAPEMERGKCTLPIGFRISG